MMRLSKTLGQKIKFSELINFTANGAGKARFFRMKQKTEITFEVEETVILRQVAGTLTAFCPQCQAVVEMLAPPSAAAICGLSERELFRLIENGRLHFTEAERIFICRNSLTERSTGNSDSPFKI
jgi:hypothetical protein